MSAKELVVAPIAAPAANRLVDRLHYSGSHVRNSQVHLGVFWKGRLEGAMQLGPPIDRRKLLGLVADTPWHGMIELNRMAFGPALPRNSESRALAVAMRLLRRQYPQLEWVVSFADATRCGDGTIYRAAGFVLTQVKANEATWVLPDGRTVNKVSITTRASGDPHGRASMTGLKAAGARPLEGFQLRYLYFLSAAARARLAVPALPFAAIVEAGAGMYRGQRTTRARGGAAGGTPAG